MKYDVIVIGGGLGGLTAGAKLAREGKKVLLIEQHVQPGGCATTFKRGDYTLEVGLHEMDGPGPKDMKTRIFAELGVTENVEFIKVPEFYRFLSDNIDITVPHDPAQARSLLKVAFPAETASIDAYFDQLLSPRRKDPAGVPVPDTSVGEFLDSIITNDELKLVLLGNLGYFHDDPYTLSLAYYTIAQGSYYTGGASFIKGGSQVLSDHLAGFITSHGGEVLLSHLVTGFTYENGAISGVTYIKMRDSSDEVLTASATDIVLNAAPENIADWLPEEYRTKLLAETTRQQTGASLLTIYFGFRDNLSAIGNTHYSTFVYDRSVRSQADIAHNNRSSFDKRSFTFIDYGRIDSGLASGGKSVGAMCCIDYLSDWENLSKSDYKRKKEEVAEALLLRLDNVLPGIVGLTDYYEVGTAATVKRYTLTPGGAVYGFARVPAKEAFNTSVLPGNLHIASAWGKTGGGFSGAIYGGYLCAINVIRARR